MKAFDACILTWLAASSLIAFCLFAYDKFRAGRGGSRVSEFHLALIGALGGWPGGLAAMLLFRHKTVKFTFQLKYAAAFLVWAGLVYFCFRWRG